MLGVWTKTQVSGLPVQCLFLLDSSTCICITSPSLIAHLLCELVEGGCKNEQDRYTVFLPSEDTDSRSAMPVPGDECRDLRSVVGGASDLKDR